MLTREGLPGPQKWPQSCRKRTMYGDVSGGTCRGNKDKVQHTERLFFGAQNLGKWLDQLNPL